MTHLRTERTRARTLFTAFTPPTATPGHHGGASPGSTTGRTDARGSAYGPRGVRACPPEPVTRDAPHRAHH
ncbi:hypothetical protein ACFVS9_29960 [Streptomyces sp. NPDC058008]|uniref:hypothetical protein n=1 Tax=Streptomyces sp. NPDC058008 TaxID=3346303 RepID=UPI0036E10101